MQTPEEYLQIEKGDRRYHRQEKEHSYELPVGSYFLNVIEVSEGISLMKKIVAISFRDRVSLQSQESGKQQSLTIFCKYSKLLCAVVGMLLHSKDYSPSSIAMCPGVGVPWAGS